MRRDLVDILACPLDKSELRLDVTRAEADADGTDGTDSEVIEGTLTCTACGEAYPIAEGIPNLLPPDLRAAMADASSEPTGH